MNKIKLSELFSSREYKDMELDPKVVDSILKKTIYRKRTSILSRAVLYLAPVTAVIIIFVLYQNFFVELQQAKNIECSSWWWGSNFYDTNCESSPPTYKKEEKWNFDMFSKDKESNLRKELEYKSDNLDEMSYDSVEIGNATISDDNISNYPKATIESANTSYAEESEWLQTFEDAWIDEDSVWWKSQEIVDNKNISNDVNTVNEAVVWSSKNWWGSFLNQQDTGETSLPGSISGSASSSDIDFIPYYIWWCIWLILILILYIIFRRKK